VDLGIDLPPLSLQLVLGLEVGVTIDQPPDSVFVLGVSESKIAGSE
jgi:hypothetical protein